MGLALFRWLLPNRIQARSMPAIEISKLEFRWPGNPDLVLQVPKLVINAGESVFLLGASGSGKSTLLNLIAGIVPVQLGSICLFGQPLETLGDRARDRLRAQHVGMVFQQFNLVPWLNVATNIRLACSFAGRRGVTGHERLPELLDSLQLDRALLLRRADTLSVGQQQRVAIARALVNAPELLIADEPTSALDSSARDSFIKLLLQVQEQRGITVLFVSHDAALARHFSRVVDMAELNPACRDRGRYAA